MVANISRKLNQVKVKPYGFAKKISIRQLPDSIFSRNLDLTYLSNLTKWLSISKKEKEISITKCVNFF